MVCGACGDGQNNNSKGWRGKLYTVPGNHDMARPLPDGLNRQKFTVAGLYSQAWIICTTFLLG